MKNLNVRLPEEVMEKLNAHKQKTGLMLVRIVEDAIRKHIGMEKK